MPGALKCYRKKKMGVRPILQERLRKGVSKVRQVVLNSGYTFELSWHWGPGHPTPFWFNWSEVGPWEYYSNMRPRLNDLTIWNREMCYSSENGKCWDGQFCWYRK